jgi:uncharacterized membrane protein HdeD (DUF308 family)
MQDKTKNNRQAMTTLVMGIVSLALSLFIFFPGILSALACAGVIGAVFALVTGIRGMRAARRLEGGRRNLATIGMIAAGLALLVFVIDIVTVILRGLAAGTRLH